MDQVTPISRSCPDLVIVPLHIFFNDIIWRLSSPPTPTQTVVLRSDSSVRHRIEFTNLFVVKWHFLSIGWRKGYFLFLYMHLHRYVFLMFSCHRVYPLLLKHFGSQLLLRRRQQLIMIFLKLLQSIFEFEDIKSMIRVEIANLEVLRDLLFLIIYSFYLRLTLNRLIQSLFHYFINFIYNHLRSTTVWLCSILHIIFAGR